MTFHDIFWPERFNEMYKLVSKARAGSDSSPTRIIEGLCDEEIVSETAATEEDDNDDEDKGRLFKIGKPKPRLGLPT